MKADEEKWSKFRRKWNIKDGDNYTHLAVEKAFMEGCERTREQIFQDIDKHIRTDMQGNPLPECKVLWEIKSKLKEVKDERSLFI